MIRKLTGLAALAFLAGACHSRGTYLQPAEPMPYGPGVVDCGPFQRTENAYVHNGCWQPVPISGTLLDVPVDPRAPRVGQPTICDPLVGAANAPAAAVVQAPAVVKPIPVAVRGAPSVAVAPAPALAQATVTVAPGRMVVAPTPPSLPDARAAARNAGEWRPARSTAPLATVDVRTGEVRTVGVPVAAPTNVATPGAGVSISSDLPDAWDDPVPPPRPGVALPAPRVELQAR